MTRGLETSWREEGPVPGTASVTSWGLLLCITLPSPAFLYPGYQLPIPHTSLSGGPRCR